MTPGRGKVMGAYYIEPFGRVAYESCGVFQDSYLGIALDLVLYLKTQFNTRNKTRGFNLGFIPQVSNQVYNPGIIGYYTCRQV